MRVIEHDPERPGPERRPERARLAFTPFRTVKVSRGRELRLDIAESARARTVSARLFRIRERDGAASVAGDPIHLFPDKLAELIAALTEAAAAIAAQPAIPATE